MAYDETELRKPAFVQFWAAQVALPGETARFFSGRGKIHMLSADWYGAGIAGEDGVFGDLEPIEGQIGETAPRLKLTLGGLQTSLLDDARSHLSQGSTVIVYDCLWDSAANDVIGDPELVFYGEVDVPSFEVGATLSIILDCTSALEYFFDTGERFRWVAATQAAIYPDDEGFDYVTDTTRQLPWGIEKAARPDYTGADVTSTAIYRRLTHT